MAAIDGNGTEGAVRALPLATPTAWINSDVWTAFMRGGTPDVICANRIKSGAWELPLYGPEAMARAERQVERSEATLLRLVEELHRQTGIDDGMTAVRALVARVEKAEAAASTPTPVSHVSAISEEVKAYIKGSVGVVEANSFETMCLWQAHHDAKKWVSNNSGFGPCVGVLDDMPVHISILSATVNEQKILFIEPTSQVVDWRLIDAWLVANLPQSAMRSDGHPNKVDAMNFGNVFPAAATEERE